MEVFKIISAGVIPVLFVLIVVYGLFKRVNVFDCFIEGAAEGLKITIRILPALVGLLAAIAMLRESGALEFIVGLLSPITKFLGIPSEVMPLALLRPVSGSGSLALVTDIVNRYGPDSFAGRVASTMMGSTETTFYTLAVYFGSVGIKNSRHTVKCALIADCVGILSSVWIWRLMGLYA